MFLTLTAVTKIANVTNVWFTSSSSWFMPVLGIPAHRPRTPRGSHSGSCVGLPPWMASRISGAWRGIPSSASVRWPDPVSRRIRLRPPAHAPLIQFPTKRLNMTAGVTQFVTPRSAAGLEPVSGKG